LVELLELMLSYNHYHRPSAKQLLKLKIFDDIRNKSIDTIAPHKIAIKYDKDPKYKMVYEEHSYDTDEINRI
jgi:hypothetical protein